MVAKAFPPVTGGVETYSEEVARAYLRRGIEVDVLTQTEGPPGWRTNEYSEGCIDLFNTGKGSQPFVFARLLAEVRRLSGKRRFDWVHATTWRPALAPFAFGRGTPLVLTVHGREVMNYPFFLKHPMIEVLRRADVVATVSNATMKVAREALHGAEPKGSWTVAFNGISHSAEARDFRRDVSDASRPVRLLSLARLVPRKNIQGCIAALAELLRDGMTGFEYWIGGKGPMLNQLRQLVVDLGLEQHVRFLGYVHDEDLPRLYQSVDVFLHPQTNVGEGNDFEGFGLVIADAMSFGCAVLAGAVGGPRDFVCHRRTGVLVDGLDHLALKQAISELVLDPALRRNLSEAGSAYALRELSWDNHVARIINELPNSRGS